MTTALDLIVANPEMTAFVIGVVSFLVFLDDGSFGVEAAMKSATGVFVAFFLVCAIAASVGIEKIWSLKTQPAIAWLGR